MLLRTTGLVFVSVFFLSCATEHALGPVGLNFFQAAGQDNPWNRKIQNWQERHEQDPALRGGEIEASTSLAEAYRDFTHELRYEVVARTVAWVQEQSRESYRPDGDRDHWATLGEVVKQGGDDCDGLDLLTFVLLRRLGFAEDEIFRAIVVEKGSGQHHMVTLWFDGTRDDPVLLDPTGVVSTGVARLSEVPDWEPIELFDEHDHFAVSTTPSGRVASQNTGAERRGRRAR